MGYSYRCRYDMGYLYGQDPWGTRAGGKGKGLEREGSGKGKIKAERKKNEKNLRVDFEKRSFLSF